MKKRLRKKLHVGEFREYGFPVEFRMLPAPSTTEYDALIDEFIAMIEHNGLCFGGGGRERWEGFVALDSRGSATAEHRQAVEDWLNNHPQIENVAVGELVDAWYGWDE